MPPLPGQSHEQRLVLDMWFVPPLRGGQIRQKRFPRIALRSILGYSRPLPPGGMLELNGYSLFPGEMRDLNGYPLPPGGMPELNGWGERMNPFCC
jgi:hypothetical protein